MVRNTCASGTEMQWWGSQIINQLQPSKSWEKSSIYRGWLRCRAWSCFVSCFHRWNIGWRTFAKSVAHQLSLFQYFFHVLLFQPRTSHTFRWIMAIISFSISLLKSGTIGACGVQINSSLADFKLQSTFFFMQRLRGHVVFMDVVCEVICWLSGKVMVLDQMSLSLSWASVSAAELDLETGGGVVMMWRKIALRSW